MEKCTACGGRLDRKNQYTYQCAHCGREYYESVDRTHSLFLQIRGAKLVIAVTAAFVCFITAALACYYVYTIKLTGDAARFSVAFREFLMEVYEKPIVTVSKEDLDKIRYLKIEKDKGYTFSYSFEDYYDYDREEEFFKTVKKVTVDAQKKDFSPSNVQYFEGLTRLELLTDAWQNYFLPKQNKIRSIVCVCGVSNYGKSDFFQTANRDTLKEVTLLNVSAAEDLAFLQELSGIRRLTLENVFIKDEKLLDGFGQLETLYLLDVDMEEEKADSILSGIFSLPSLKELTLSGRGRYYLTDAEWEALEKKYPDIMVFMEE